MEGVPEPLRITAEPARAVEIRRYVRESSRLDSMRLTEADLLVTELVGNAIVHGRARELIVEVAPRAGSHRISVAHQADQPLGEVGEHGFGWSLMDRISERWGHDFESGMLTVWFDLRSPGVSTVLSDADEEDLLGSLADNPDASGELLERYRSLARGMARRFRGKGVSDDDLEQVAMMGLLKAIQRFDPSLGDLRSYAAATISGELKRSLRDSGWSVRVPRSTQERSLRAAKAAEGLRQKLGRHPTVAEISEQTGMTLDEVNAALMARFAYQSHSIDAPISESGATLGELLAGDDLDPSLAGERTALTAAISRLPQRQRQILHYRFNEDLTQSEIADILGISQMHVSRLLRRSLNALQTELVAIA